MSRTVNLTLVDVQSWEGENQISLSQNGCTVIRARSETGKSTICRFLLRFVEEPETRGPCYTDIIRRGSTQCALIFTKDDNTKDIFMMTTTGRVLARTDTAGNILESYLSKDINEEILEHFGIIYDSKNHIVLNVFSRDLPLLFVDTSESFNGAFLSRVLIDRDMENLLSFLKNLQDSISVSVKSNEYKEIESLRAEQMLVYVDAEKLKYQLSQYQHLQTLLKGLQNYYTLFHAYELLSAQSKTLKSPNYSLEECLILQSLLNDLDEYEKYLVTYDSITTKKSSMKILPAEELHILLDQYQLITQFEIFLNQIPIQQPQCYLNTDILESVFDTFKLVQYFDDLLTAITAIELQLIQAKEQEQMYNNQIDSLKESMKICPVCGKEF